MNEIQRYEKWLQEITRTGIQTMIVCDLLNIMVVLTLYAAGFGPYPTVCGAIAVCIYPFVWMIKHLNKVRDFMTGKG